MPTADEGPATSCPCSSSFPALGRSRPHTSRKSVDLPHPEVPTRLRISCSRTLRSTSCRAVCSSPAPTKCLVTPVISSIALLLAGGEAVLPGGQGAAGCRNESVGELAGDGKEQQRADNDRRAPGHLTVDRQEAQTLTRPHQLGGDDEHPSQGQPRPQARQIARQGGGDQDPAH